MSECYHILLARGPGPESDFIELEDDDGHGMGGFEWQTREGGIAVLVLPTHEAELAALKAEIARLTEELTEAHSEVHAGAHLHARATDRSNDLAAQRDALRKRIEEALKGYIVECDPPDGPLEGDCFLPVYGSRQAVGLDEDVARAGDGARVVCVRLVRDDAERVRVLAEPDPEVTP